jgi:hypothetical protein
LHVSVRGSLGACELRTRLLGAFNADNLLAALGVLALWGFRMEDAAGALSQVVAPPGRMERFGGGPRTSARDRRLRAQPRRTREGARGGTRTLSRRALVACSAAAAIATPGSARRWVQSRRRTPST